MRRLTDRRGVRLAAGTHLYSLECSHGAAACRPDFQIDHSPYSPEHRLIRLSWLSLDVTCKKCQRLAMQRHRQQRVSA